MITNRQLFFQYIGQTSNEPLAVEIEKALGIWLYGPGGKKYIDLVSGVSVSNLGHSHPEIIKAVKEQSEKYMHLMVYGEIIQSPQVQYAKLLTDQLSEKLNSVYYVNSGSEAIEGALKLAKRYTGKHEIIAFKNAYHGGTHGALSLMSDETLTQAFRPLLPSIKYLDFNNIDQLTNISEKTAAVVIETIQGEAGIIPGEYEFVQMLRKRCNKTGSLLIIDEIQTGFGRTGTLFAYEQYNIVPDILVIAKAMGGGMPIGAFIAEKDIMNSFTYNPTLGHITTFGGHPVSTAAALAHLKVLTDSNLIEKSVEKGERYIEAFKDHPKIKAIRGKGLYIALELENADSVQKLLKIGVEIGFISDPFLFDLSSFRISPPLTITDEEIDLSIEIISEALQSI